MSRIARSLLALLVAAVVLAPSASAQSVSVQSPERLDPNGTRLFVSPTARTLPKGQGRFSDYFVFFPSVAYGFTDWLDASAGVSLIPFSSFQIVTVNLKAQVLDGDRLDLAVGNLFATPVGDGTGEGFGGVAYGLATFGSARQSLTLGTYVGYAGFDASTTTCSGDVCETESGFDVDVSDGALFLVGGETQVSGSVKLLSENYLVLENGAANGAVSAGVRFFGDRLAADFALFLPVGEDIGGGFPFFPYVGFAYNFGR